jgi:hypothetical protein
MSISKKYKWYIYMQIYVIILIIHPNPAYIININNNNIYIAISCHIHIHVSPVAFNKFAKFATLGRPPWGSKSSSLGACLSWTPMFSGKNNRNPWKIMERHYVSDIV